MRHHAIAIVGLLLAYLAGGAYTETFPRPFKSESWIVASGNSFDDEPRCGMLADLTFRVGFKGKTREEVVALLSEPEDRHRGGTSRGNILVSEGLAETWTGSRRSWC